MAVRGRDISEQLDKMGKAILLGLVTIAMVIPGSGVALSQSAPAPWEPAPPFTAIELNPSGFPSSVAHGISGGQQVGESTPTNLGGQHALLWRGSAASVVDLHPRGFVGSFAMAVCGGQQVGYGDGHALLWRGSGASVVDLHPARFATSEAHGTSGGQQVGFGSTGRSHALLWRGSAGSVVDLHPRGFDSSESLGTSGAQQVGWGIPNGGTLLGGPSHALLWRGSAASVVDLHPSGFDSSEALGTSGGQQVGWGVPTGGTFSRGPFHALLWRGSAGSVVDLHPSRSKWGFVDSQALATSGGQQVGWGGWGLPGWNENHGGPSHALLWRGSADSVVDLHLLLPQGFESSYALGIDATGDVVGFASTEGAIHTPYAFLWKRDAPTPGTSSGQDIMRCENQP